MVTEQATRAQETVEAAADQKERIIFSAYEVGRTKQDKYEPGLVTSGELSRVTENMSIMEVYGYYEKYPTLDYLPVQNEKGIISGYIRREMFLAALSRGRYSRELLMRPDVHVSKIMDTRVVCIKAYAGLSEAAEILLARDEQIRFDPFVITLDGKYYGATSVRRVMDSLNHYFKLDMKACLEAQEKLMRSHDTSIENTLNYSCFVSPLNGPGGDYAEVFDVNEKFSMAVLFDVCGKGLKASNMVTALASLFKSMLSFYGKKIKDMREFNLPGKLRKLNKILCDMTPSEMYASGVVILFDKERKIIQVFDFGHSMIWLRRESRNYSLASAPEDPSKISFFGIDESCPMEFSCYRLKEGDMLLTCSDGVTEAKNPQKMEFGSKSLRYTMGKHTDPQKLIEEVLDNWEAFRKGYRRGDDVSILAVSI